MSFWTPNLQRQGFEDALLDHHKKQHRSVWESLVHSGVYLGGQDMNRPGRQLRVQRAKVQCHGTALEWCQQHWEQDDEENQEPQLAKGNNNIRKARIQMIIRKTMYNTRRAGQAGGGSFKEKNYKSKKEFAYRMCTGWPTTALPKPSFLSEWAFSRSMVVMWWPVLMWIFACEVTWGEVMWLVARCHVMSCDVMWCGVMSCDVIFCVVLCHVMQCDVVMCSHVMSVICCQVMRCNGMRSHEFVMRCGWLRCHVVWFEVVVWCGELENELVVLLRTPRYYKVLLHSTTKYYRLLLQYYFVLQSTTPVLCTTPYYKVLLCTTKYYSSTTTTPVLQSTTSYYSSTTLYYKVLLQYYKVLLRYYKVLLGTTKYYSGTTRYYSVLHSTTPVLLCTTKYYSSTTKYHPILQSTTPYYRVSNTKYYTVLQSTTQYYSGTTKNYSVLQRITPFDSPTHETPSTMREAIGVTFGLHQMLRLPRKMILIDPCLTWIVQYNARSNRCDPPTSPNMSKYVAYHEKWLSWLIRATYETSFTMRGATGITLQPHQILRLPRKMILMIDPCHIWIVQYNARSNRHHPPTSPNTSPATKNDSHDWSSSHMQRHLQ